MSLLRFLRKAFKFVLVPLDDIFMATYTEHLPSPALSDVSAHSNQGYLPARHHERRLGDTEASYFLPSRESGVNDMFVVWSLSDALLILALNRYLHLGFNAPARYVRRSRVRLVWAILRVRHPLLASRVQMHDYEDIRFVYVSHHVPMRRHSTKSHPGTSPRHQSRKLSMMQIAT